MITREQIKKTLDEIYDAEYGLNQGKDEEGQGDNAGKETDPPAPTDRPPASPPPTGGRHRLASIPSSVALPAAPVQTPYGFHPY